MYVGPLATSCISFFKHTGEFNFAGTTVSFEQIGLAIADAIMRQQKFVQLGTVEVTPNYLFGMMQFAAREGWFTDEVFDFVGVDHKFDPNEPTPGAHWNKVRVLRRMAREEAGLAKQFKEMGCHSQCRAHAKQAALKSREADALANKMV